MKIRMLHGRRLVHLTDEDADEHGGYLACPYEGYYDFHLDGPWRNAERVADDEPLTCKHCLRLTKPRSREE